MTFRTSVLLLACLSICLVPAFAQIPIAAPPTDCGAQPNTPYNYFASSGIGYEPFSKLPSISTGFGLKMGACSNMFLVTTIGTGVGHNNPNPGYGVLSEHLEYHLAHTEYFEFIGEGQLGVVQVGTAPDGTATSATFGGGVAVAGDLGWLLSKKRFHLPAVFHVNYVTAPQLASNVVKPSYLFDLRKTF